MAVTARIRVLPDALVNQIAAGEVVERPASVVKELVENAIDAGASSITVEIEDGGVTLIRVSDDGSGMSREDAALAVTRHATSKIRTAEDLVAIHTLGFRGEALPSMASVSRFRLVTRLPEAEGAVQLDIEGGAASVLGETGAAKGTSVTVADLFYNVPARRKFLRSQPTEAAHVSEVVLRAAMSRPDVRFVLLRGGRRVFDLPRAASVAERVRAAFERETLVEIESERDHVKVFALLGAPETARSGAGSLHLFVNGRPVRDRALARAVAFAYGSVLPPGRYPAGAVYVTVPEELVDVNVHPQKAEVRFAKASAVHEGITRALAAKLGTSAWSGASSRGAAFWNARLAPGPLREGAAPAAATPYTAQDPWGLAGAMHDGGGATYGATPQASGQGALPVDQGTGFFSRLRCVGQVRNMFLLCEGDEALVVLDQHAADERVRYHRLRTAYAARAVATQQLLFPDRVELTPEESAWIDAEGATLAALGFDCSWVGDRTLAIRAVPTLVARASPTRLLRDVLAEATRTGERNASDAVDTAIATMACHSAIRAGDALTPAECHALLRSLDEVEDFAGHCPHGRPIAHTLPFRDLERFVGR